MEKTILTVDDSASMRALISESLTTAGYNTIQAKDGLEALEQLNKNTVHCIISDINMPNMNGIELIKEVRKNPENRFLPIIMLTTESSPEQKLEGKAAGATGWIIKPFDANKLLGALRKVVK